MPELFEIEGSSEAPRANIVFLHGLTGHPRDTWRHGDGNDDFWPSWLIEDIPGLRVFSASYEAPASRWSSESMDIVDRAVNLSALMISDEKILSAPLVLIGHSLGGLLIKELIRNIEGSSAHNPTYARLLKQIKLVILIAAPNSGSRLATIPFLLIRFLRPTSLTQSLKQNDSHLRSLNDWYRSYSFRRIKHLVFTETQSSGLLGPVVDRSSSDPGIMGVQAIPIDADHIKICKPASRTDLVYAAVKSSIIELLASPALSLDSHQSSGIATSRKPRLNRLKARMQSHKGTIVESAENKPFIVMICGPQWIEEIPRSSNDLVDKIAEHLKAEGFDVVLGEDAGVSDPRIYNEENNSISNELDFFRTKCNAVIIVADSIGTWCELGLLSWYLSNNKEVRDKGVDFIVLVNKSYSNGNIFFRRGPFTIASALGKAEFIDFANFEPHAIVDRLRERRSIYTADRRGRPRSIAT